MNPATFPVILLVAAIAIGACKDTSDGQKANTEPGTSTEADAGASGGSDTGSGSATSSETDTSAGTDPANLFVCDGMVCNEPPANTCEGTFELNLYNEAGWCEVGRCVYGGRFEQCAAGICESGICSEAPCQGVRCDKPPTPQCLDGTTLQIFNEAGYCTVTGGAPSCLYASELRACTAGCQDGRCGEDAPCAGVRCDDAPATYCNADSALVIWDTVAKCEAGECRYTHQTVPCDDGCAAGGCVGADPCANITCLSPPASYCLNDATLRTFAGDGSCEAGSCIYSPDDIRCASGCAAGRCVNEPCAGVTCDRPPVSYCQDAATLVYWDGSPGVCEQGVCRYDTTTATCAGGCSGGRCADDPCLGVACNTPPAAHCASDAVLVSYPPPGRCTPEGGCAYTRAEITCAGGCARGACVSQGPNNDTDTEMETDSTTVTDATGDTATAVDTGQGTVTGQVADCVGQPDFTSCSVLTDPDLSYDICVDEICVSPGCGELSCNVPAPHFPIPDTGQRNCYNSDALLERCPVPGEDYYGQDAHYGWDLTHLLTERYTRDITTDPDRPLVIDHLTGLMWQGCHVGETGASCDGLAQEYAHEDNFVNCDVLDWAGYTDWRAPDLFEMISIADRGGYSFDQDVFPDSGSNFTYTTTTSSGEGDVWAYGGGTTAAQTLASSGIVRCVRGGPMAVRRFESSVSSGDPVVADLLNGLVWQACVSGLSGLSCEAGEAVTHTWKDALAHCEALEWGGYTDWRLPNIFELQWIQDLRTRDPGIDAGYFPATPTGGHWSSTSNYGFPSNAFRIDFSDGKRSAGGKTGSSYVRCVRGGPA